MRDDSPSRQQRIRDLVDQIARLSDELQSLVLPQEPPPLAPAVVIPLADPQPPPPEVPDDLPPRSANPYSTAHFRTNDRIVIENNRNGLRGETGVVTNVNDSFVYFRLDSTNTVIWRSPRNIRRLQPPP